MQPLRADGRMIAKASGCTDTFQDLYPDDVVSYKAHCCEGRNPRRFKSIPEKAKIICFHGKPRPWEIIEL
ncbi:MAG: hypothetical protein U9M89_02770 [Patescibacteria group bacterium]|nr:hypothetical protein [Patescibacteria group bacterium]